MSIPIQFGDHGLVPVVVQDHLTGEVRMVAYATAEAIEKTVQTGRATFWSRSRGELWEKGRTSGNVIDVRRVLVDCDADCVVYSSEPHGPSCHTGAESCFFQVLEDGALSQASDDVPALAGLAAQTLLATLEAVLESRKKATGDKSYTKSLYDAGPAAMGAKVREEADELGRALESEGDDRVVSEAADLLYHLLVAIRWRSIPFRSVLAELGRRLGTSGHTEKASRSAPQPPR
jgi:phosphoribosyl-ATP pyrophosphohydrolase/phosphoribosyl-AMP cyclohydrolase